LIESIYEIIEKKTNYEKHPYCKKLFVLSNKSLAGISIKVQERKKWGWIWPEMDAHWEENQFITQRRHPDLSLYPKIIDGKIEITNLGKTHSFCIDDFEKPISVNVWDDESEWLK
jgi:hypothetical protein